MLVDRLTSGMVGAEVEFRFSTEWEQLIKTAVFIAGSEKRVVLEAEWRDNICTIPHECLAAPDVHLLAGVYGTTPDGSLVIPTVYADLGMIWTGTDPNGESGAEASPELWAQLQAQVNLMESSANKVSSISEASTDEQYPSARAVYEALAADNGGSVVIEGTVSADMSEVTISTLDAWAKVSEAWNDAKHPPVVLRLSDEVCAYLTSVSSMEDFNGQSMGVALFSFPPAYMLNSAPPYSIWLFENNEAVILNTLERIMSDVSTAGVQNKVIKKYVDDTAAGLQTALGGYQPAGDYALRSELFGGSYNDLTDRPEIPEAVTEQTVAGWGFTKNTGTYSKPSSGIPRADLAADVQTSLGKADTALQSHQSLAGYATESWVTAKGYQTADQVQSAIDAAVGDIDALIGSGVIA